MLELGIRKFFLNLRDIGEMGEDRGSERFSMVCVCVSEFSSLFF